MSVTPRNAPFRPPALVRAVRTASRGRNWIEGRRPLYVRRAPFLADLAFDEVRFSLRGHAPEEHLRRTRRLLRLAEADVLVLGCGSGQELPPWLREQPRSLTAVDRFRNDGWSGFPSVRFEEMDIRRLDFEDASFDLVVSAAVLEHVQEIEELAREMRRVMRPGGIAFAQYGPLFYTFGGAHYLGRYEHLWLSDEAFRDYLRARDIPIERQEGLRWLEQGMMSRRTYDEVDAALRSAFDVQHLILFVSPEGLRFRAERPDEWASLRSRYHERDLLVSGAAVWLRAR